MVNRKIIGESRFAFKYIAFFFVIATVLILFHTNAFAAFSINGAPAVQDGDTKITLNWTTFPNAESYEIFRDGVSVKTIVVGTSPDYRSYTDLGLTPKTHYDYEIKAYDNHSAEIASATITGGVTTAKIPKPVILSQKYDINTHIVTLHCICKSLAVVNFVITQAITGGHALPTIPAVPDATTGIIDLTFSDPDLAVTMQYVVQARYDQTNYSDDSDPVTITVIQPPEITNTSSANGTVNLTWTNYAQIDQFNLESCKWTNNSWPNNSWTIVSNNPGATGVSLQVSTAGKYKYRLEAKGSSNYSGVSNESDPADIPGAPANLTATFSILNNAINGITLNWVVDPDNLTALHVARRQPDGSYVFLGSLNKTIATYTDLIPVTVGTTYTYRVYAFDVDTNTEISSDCSITASVPAAPSSLILTLTSGSSVTVQWADNSSNETGFRIERKMDAGTYSVIASPAANTTSYNDNTVQTGHTYTYRGKATGMLGDSSYTAEVSTVVAETAVPAALTATPASSTQIDLAWTYSGGGNYVTIIERKTDTGGTWSTIRTTTSGTVKYSDYGLTPNTQYFYRVRNSLSSGAASIPFPNDDIGKGAFTMLPSLSLSGAASSGGSISLSWSGNTTGAEAVVERKMASGSFSSVAVVGSSDTGWTDTSGLVPGASYTYRVKARNGSNESAYSTEVTVVNYYLNAPSNLTVTPNATGGIDLSWTDNSTDETGFEIWRSVIGTVSNSPYATVGKNIVNYTDGVVQTGVQYYYTVRAYSSASGLYSPSSNTASIGLGLISPPTNLHSSYISNNQVQLLWNDNSSDENGFRVEWKIGDDGAWNVLASLAVNTTSYTVTGLSQYSSYFFRVRAYKYYGNADSVSNEIKVSTAIPPAPSDVKAVAASSAQINISWKDNSDDELGFRVLRRTTNQGFFDTIAELGTGATSYTDKGVYANIKYFYKVVAYNANGASESAEISTTTSNNVTFADVTSNLSWARDAIESLSGRGIIKGKSGKLFKPNDTITKAEFVSLMIRAFNLGTVPVGSLADVKPGKWYYNDVMTAENLGIIYGGSNSRFYPDRAITREEIAVIIYKTMDVAGKTLPGHDNSVLEKFSDKNLVTPANLSYVSSLIGEGVMEGISGAIAPKKTATRAQAAVFIYRVIDR